MKCFIKQGGNLSTTLFDLFIKELAFELKQLGSGVMIGDEKQFCLFYADDIWILAEHKQELNTMLRMIYMWTRKLCLLINYGKTNVIHVRPTNVVRSDSSYRHLRCYLNKLLDFIYIAQVLAESAGRVIGSIINKYKWSGGINYKVYKT